MVKSKKDRISVEGNSQSLKNNPFGALDGLSPSLPAGEIKQTKPDPIIDQKPSKKGRIDIKRVVGGRGGKTVTLIEGEAFEKISQEELKVLSLRLKKTCGAGGTVKSKTLEVQGDKREAVARVLEKEGYRVVFAGG